MTEQEHRQKVVDIAKSYLKTPFHMGGRIKGVGVDCVTMLLNVFEEAELLPHIELPNFKIDFHLHRSTEFYLEGVMKYCHKIELLEVQPGDILLFKTGRIVSHGALVVDFPKLIHVINSHGCTYVDFNEISLKNRFNSAWCFDFDK
jgi:cell wall-associated NlpC family hydrolase